MRQLQEWPTNADSDGLRGNYSDGIIFDDPTPFEEIIEPRLKRILDYIIPNDPVISGQSMGNNGMLIFCGFRRTVGVLRSLLHKQIINANGNQVKIIAHAVTGEHPDSISLLNSLSKPDAQAEGIYNIVIGTSAIQEGISMNWASTVVHWDLPPNPQTLEQRTWRLDRHRTEIDSDVFNTVYMVTNTESDEEMVKRIRQRAELSDTLLGRTHIANAWPIMFLDGTARSEPKMRSYEGEQSPFFYTEAKQLAEAWNLQTDVNSDEYFIRTQQQKILFQQLFNLRNIPIRVPPLIENGGIEFEDWDNNSEASLHELINLAEGTDLNTIQKCYPPAHGARPNFLRIDGFPHVERQQKGRHFAISIDPNGILLQRIMRRHNSTESYVIGPKDSPAKILFSIERENTLEEFQLDFNTLYSSCFPSPSKLFVIDVEDSQM